MSDTPHRRFADRGSGNPTFVGAGTTLIGNLECGADLIVAGRVQGEGVVRGALTLSAGGRWEGLVCAANAVIAGEVEGSVRVENKLEIRHTARIRGSVNAAIIAIAQGAVLDGDVAVTSAAPVVHFEEKRFQDGETG
ncbi:bactofilin family protein [Steroidobacter denitrificans]|nr:polymer-forming cytoskeletal protein [Steroidobacter denitrificans]